jgi:hypothetical protein
MELYSFRDENNDKFTVGDLNIAYTKRIYIQSTNPNVPNHQLFY